MGLVLPAGIKFLIFQQVKKLKGSMSLEFTSKFTTTYLQAFIFIVVKASMIFAGRQVGHVNYQPTLYVSSLASVHLD